MTYDELLTFFEAVKQDRENDPLIGSNAGLIAMGEAEPSAQIARMVESLTGERARLEDEQMAAMLGRLTSEPDARRVPAFN
ncbi:hypothetical protein GRI97_17025 [Altererythrobacter xixiisoli]|uniref:Uncharacterized protein n=1 Tax=Croceibacterium xixiisoli TaxID=1476466 RepID=A0A6I4TXE7_9SPHN|nr:hypothetical protein [Croceibacterium xixiisoli]MXP00697.1 hypothetical protein [Croceibacterium xixiisoli]